MEKARVLFVDDLERARQLFVRAVDRTLFDATSAGSVVEAEEAIRKQAPDVIITDLRMPDVDGLEGIARYRQLVPDVPVIVVTAFGSVETAVEAMRRGAFDYVSKPFDQDQIEIVLKRALEHRRLRAENLNLRVALQEKEQTQANGNVVGRSPAILAALALVARVAPTDYPVLIQGESGTGKDVFARLVHERSTRAGKAFVSLNCSAIPEHLLESELFGHEKGAFSGAIASRTGFFSRADGGSFFLDEIGDMSLGLQPKLLRVLQDGEYYPVGARKAVRADVRLIAASNQNIPAQVESGKFRQDLYYRINTVRIVLPPLRERPEDVPALAQHFLSALHARRLPFPPPTHISDAALARLCGWSWPGNVRELAHTIERAAIVADGDTIELENLPPELLAGLGHGHGAGPATAGGSVATPPGVDLPYQEARRNFEARYFARLLDEAGGNVQKAAEVAGLHRTTLYEKLSKLGIAPKG